MSEEKKTYVQRMQEQRERETPLIRYDDRVKETKNTDPERKPGQTLLEWAEEARLMHEANNNKGKGR